MHHVITSITEHHYIYANETDNDYVLELRYYGEDTTACVYDENGEYVGEWKIPLDSITYDVESHVPQIIAMFTSNGEAHA